MLHDQRANLPLQRVTWEDHWRAGRQDAACVDSPEADLLLDAYWERMAGSLPSTPQRIVDLCCGNGTVLGRLAKRRSSIEDLLLGIDSSHSGLVSLRSMHPRVAVCCADASNLPVADGTMDLVCSQFGVEYAGMETIMSLPKMLAPAGKIALVMHISGGAIHQGCATSLAATNALISSSVFKCAAAVFIYSGPEAAMAFSQPGFKAADADFAAAIKMVETTLKIHGTSVAGGQVWRLYCDLAAVYSRLEHHEAGPLLAWIEKLTAEFSAYRQRMQWMVDAAIDTQSQNRLVSGFVEQGFDVECHPLTPSGPDPTPFALSLTAQRRRL